MASTILVNELWTGDHFTTAEKIAIDLDLNDRQREILMPWIVNGCRTVKRAHARRAEEFISVVKPKTPRKPPARANLVDGELADDPRLKFLDESFALPNGEYRTWRLATLKDHEMRISLLEMQRGALHRSADKHRAAIAQIVMNHVSCLGDLYPPPSAGSSAVVVPVRPKSPIGTRK